jgi:hypothetical protein
VGEDAQPKGSFVGSGDFDMTQPIHFPNHNMNAAALRKARSALGRARQELRDLIVSNDFNTLEKHWERLLDEANKVFTRLEQASKASKAGMEWWGKHVHQWRVDQLLSYIRAARDVSQHSIQEIAREHNVSARQVAPTPEETEAAHRAFQKVGKPYALLGLIEVTPAHAAVLEITNRKKVYPPPASHLGVPVTNNTPGAIGELALSYLEQMMKEAESLAS